MKTLLFFILSTFTVLSQITNDSIVKKKTNPIIYGDMFFGPSLNKNSGTVFIGASMNYQNKSNLFTIRYIENLEIATKWVFIFPTFINKSRNQETALLFGQRFIEGNQSLSFSGGISYNQYEEYNYNTDTYFLSNVPTDIISSYSENFIGFPFEAEIRWFNAKKQRYRIVYALIPIGEPTSFCRSIGFKLVGNISKQSYIGIGLTFGLGWHKEY